MNPILKRTLTGLAVGAVVICAALFAPESIIWFAVSVLTALAGMEFSVLYCNKVEIGKARDLALFARLAGYLLGWAVVSCLVVLAFMPSRYGDATCGPFRLGNVMLLYVIAIVKFSDIRAYVREADEGRQPQALPYDLAEQELGRALRLARRLLPRLQRLHGRDRLQPREVARLRRDGGGRRHVRRPRRIEIQALGRREGLVDNEDHERHGRRSSRRKSGSEALENNRGGENRGA